MLHQTKDFGTRSWLRTVRHYALGEHPKGHENRLSSDLSVTTRIGTLAALFAAGPMRPIRAERNVPEASSSQQMVDFRSRLLDQ
jgi:hypothetical protein